MNHVSLPKAFEMLPTNASLYCVYTTSKIDIVMVVMDHLMVFDAAHLQMKAASGTFFYSG